MNLRKSCKYVFPHYQQVKKEERGEGKRPGREREEEGKTGERWGQETKTQKRFLKAFFLNL